MVMGSLLIQGIKITYRNTINNTNHQY